MKRNIKRLAMGILCLLMVISSAACKDTKDTKTSGDPATDGDVVQVGQPGKGSRELQPVPQGDWKQPYKTMVNITTVKGSGADQVFEKRRQRSQ